MSTTLPRNLANELKSAACRVLTAGIEQMCDESGLEAYEQASAVLSVFAAIAASYGMSADAIKDMAISGIDAASEYLDQDRSKA